MRLTKKAKLSYSQSELERLQSIAKSQTAPIRSVLRAKVLLKYIDGMTITKIASDLNTNRPLVERCINKAISYGVLTALQDLPGRGVKATITDDAKNWILSISCLSPKEVGYPHEVWTYSLLREYIRSNCVEVGYKMLERIDKGMLNKILSKGNLKPHKISYYLEKRDSEFEVKMANVLQVYKEIAMINERGDTERKMTTLSYDEKPGIQAIKNIGAQLQPVPYKHSTVQRDYEYKRLGTVSLLAAIDLHTGNIIPKVYDKHRSKEFIAFLEEVDREYPADWKIRMVLDNHSAHVSKETAAWLLTKPGRFEFVFTPKHGSWLNMIEMFFSKVARSFLRHIRVASKEELVERIYKGIEMMNKEPVVFKWKYKMEEIQII